MVPTWWLFLSFPSSQPGQAPLVMMEGHGLEQLAAGALARASLLIRRSRVVAPSFTSSRTPAVSSSLECQAAPQPSCPRGKLNDACLEGTGRPCFLQYCWMCVRVSQAAWFFQPRIVVVRSVGVARSGHHPVQLGPRPVCKRQVPRRASATCHSKGSSSKNPGNMTVLEPAKRKGRSPCFSGHARRSFPSSRPWTDRDTWVGIYPCLRERNRS